MIEPGVDWRRTSSHSMFNIGRDAAPLESEQRCQLISAISSSAVRQSLYKMVEKNVPTPSLLLLTHDAHSASLSVESIPETF